MKKYAHHGGGGSRKNVKSGRRKRGKVKRRKVKRQTKSKGEINAKGET
jgi:hypothetical protein